MFFDGLMAKPCEEALKIEREYFLNFVEESHKEISMPTSMMTFGPDGIEEVEKKEIPRMVISHFKLKDNAPDKFYWASGYNYYHPICKECARERIENEDWQMWNKHSGDEKPLEEKKEIIKNLYKWNEELKANSENCDCGK